MKLTVIGGTSGTGARLVQLAVAAGHDVTIVSRRSPETPSPGVSHRPGDAGDRRVADAAVAGADAVVVTVGGASGREDNRTRVTRTVVDAMRAAGVRRLVVQSSLGAGDSMALMPVPARVFARTALGKALADHEGQERAVRSSGLDWTVVRPGGLVDGGVSGVVVAQETAERRPMKSRISRAELGAYILAILEDPATYGKEMALGTA